MKGFFKIMLATMVGMLLMGLVMFIFLIIIGVSAGSKSAVVKPQSVLVLDLSNAEVSERVASDNPAYFLKEEQGVQYIGLNDWQRVLESAAKDANIKGISLELGQLFASPATVEAMRDALLEFRKSGKFVYAYAVSMSQSDYYLATAADSVFLHPQGGMMFKGLSAQVMYYKDLFDKLDVDIQVVRHGQFKSAVEPYISNKMSEANRLQMTEYIQSIWNTYCTQIAASRKLEMKTLNGVADNLMLYDNPQAALSTRFVDGLMYEDVYRSALKLRVNPRDTDKVSEVDYSDYFSAMPDKKTAPNKVAVVYAVGTITDGEGASDEIGENIIEALQKIRRNKAVKAVVLRVNSPGGSALMSDRIWNEVNKLKKDIPVVVSMGDYAASGGYYISCAADCIVAEPTTVTGSIGVFGMIPNLGKTLSHKLGVHVETVNTNASSDFMTGFRGMNATEYDVLQQSVDRIYDTFVHRVAVGRHLNAKYVDGIAQGRVWTGQDALTKGLVDTLGGLDLAIRIAADQAKLAKYSVIERPVMETFFERLMTSVSSVGMRLHIGKVRESRTPQSVVTPYVELEKSLRENQGVQARLPYIISIQ